MAKKLRKGTDPVAYARLLKILKDCGPDGNATLLIQLAESTTPNGTQRISVSVMRSLDENGGRPRCEEWLTWNLARALGYRYSERHKAIIMGGHGYCRATQLAGDIYSMTGHAVYVQSLDFFAGPNGWYPKAPERA